MTTGSQIDRDGPVADPPLRRRMQAALAALVLSLAAGVPLRSARTLLPDPELPDPDGRSAPYLGF